jgi:transcriptional regulator with XRE-family HTH domain
MSLDALDNYLRMHRKRAGFSQDEIAVLLGSSAGAKISRYESGSRELSLETALALEAIFGVPVAELFAGRFEAVRRKVKKRSYRLVRKLRATEESGKTYQKLQSLLTLIKSL